MGGGDAKFLFSFFLLIPYANQKDFLFVLFSVTALICLVLLALNTIKDFKSIFRSILIRDWRGVFSHYGRKIPFAPIIFFAWVYWGWESRLF